MTEAVVKIMKINRNVTIDEIRVEVPPHASEETLRSMYRAMMRRRDQIMFDAIMGSVGGCTR